MLERNSSIFFKMTRENEDATTELLCNLLSIKFIRDICLDYFGIGKEVYDTISLEHITTQYSAEGTRPDIRIENNKTLYFIENKIHKHTCLRENQVTKYPEIIDRSKKDNKGCIFLVPKNYDHLEKLRETEKNYPSAKIRIVIWDNFFEYLSKHEIDRYSPVIKESLDYFANVILKNSSFGDFTLNNYEVAAMYQPKLIYDVISLLEKNKNVIKEVAEKCIEELKKQGYDFKRNEKEDLNDLNGQGVYLNYNGKDVLFLGLTPHLYKIDEGDYVYSLAIAKGALKVNFSINKENYPYYDENENNEESWIYIKIDREIFLDDSETQKANLREKVLDIIKEVFLGNCKKSKAKTDKVVE